MDRLVPEELDFTPPAETAEHFAALKAEYETAVDSGDEGWTANVASEWRKKTGLSQAAYILDTITAHFLEFGPVWDKTARELAGELDYHNAWGEDEAGEGGTYRPTSLTHLRAASRRSLRNLEDDGRRCSAAHRVARYLDSLIGEALAADQALHGLMMRHASPAPDRTP